MLDEIRKLLPFPLLGFDTDNDSVFLNETVRDYCQAAGIVVTRCRPYRKNDQAWVEQKNGTVVRRTVGYRRFEGLGAAAALAQLYRSLRLFVNYFQPSFKLAGKAREGSRVRKRYHTPATPYQRLLADARTPDTLRQDLEAVYATLDPVRLLSDIRQAQARLVEIADQPVGDPTSAVGAPTLEQFLSGLRTAWQYRRGSTDVAPEGDEKARSAASGPVRCGHRRDFALGLTPSHGERAESSSSGCRRRTQEPSPMPSYELCSVGSRTGVGRGPTRWCSVRSPLATRRRLMRQWERSMRQRERRNEATGTTR